MLYQKAIFRLFFIWPLVCICGLAVSQPPRGPFVISPQILADKKVTFSYLAPSAKEVRLAGSQFGASNVPMKKRQHRHLVCNSRPDKTGHLSL
jgi:enterochelin esterase family protein